MRAEIEVKLRGVTLLDHDEGDAGLVVSFQLVENIFS